MKCIFILTVVLPFLSLSQKDYRFLAKYQDGDYSGESTHYNTKSTACSNTTDGTIGLINCGDIGTSAFTTNTQTSVFDNVGPTPPSTNPPCGPNGNNAFNTGAWHQYDLEAGVSQVLVDYAGGFVGGGGFAELWVSFYQGADCSSLTNVGCGQLIDKSGPDLILFDVAVNSLDDTQPLWVFVWSNNKDYDIDLSLTGVGSAPANDVCGSASNSALGCNLGASGATFTAPSTALGSLACNGGTWYSNENTVFYTFTATDIVGSISIQNLTCNDGVVGEAQIGVWTDCASLGTYGANYLGCAVGTGGVGLPSLNIGDTYIIAIDGQAGDACTWDIVTTGVALPVEFVNLKATRLANFNQITWSTLSESNADYFEVQRSDDGKTFYPIENIPSSGNSQSELSYACNDRNLSNDIVYYRVKQVDLNGEFSYHGPTIVDGNRRDKMRAYPNPAIDEVIIVLDQKFRNSQINVQDLSGRILQSFFKSNQSDEVSIDLTSFDDGVYFVTLVNSQGDLEKIRFVKD